MARAVQTARQGLGKSQSQGARVSASRLHQAHVEKAMQSRMISPDRLLDFVLQPSLKKNARTERNDTAKILGARTDISGGCISNNFAGDCNHAAGHPY